MIHGGDMEGVLSWLCVATIILVLFSHLVNHRQRAELNGERKWLFKGIYGQVVFLIRIYAPFIYSYFTIGVELLVKWI